MTNMDFILKAADHAAQATDRWMFVFILIVFLAALTAMWRWFVADRRELAQRLTAVTDRHITQGEELAKVVTNNTAALNEVRGVITKCQFQSHR